MFNVIINRVNPWSFLWKGRDHCRYSIRTVEEYSRREGPVKRLQKAVCPSRRCTIELINASWNISVLVVDGSNAITPRSNTSCIGKTRWEDRELESLYTVLLVQVAIRSSSSAKLTQVETVSPKLVSARSSMLNNIMYYELGCDDSRSGSSAASDNTPSAPGWPTLSDSSLRLASSSVHPGAMGGQ